MSAPPRSLAAASERLRRDPPAGYPRGPGRPRKGPAPAPSALADPASGQRERPTAARTSGAAVPTVCPLRPRLLDIRGAAQFLGISTWTVRDLLAAGRLARVRLPLEGDRECRKVLVAVEDLDRLVEAGKS